MSRVSYLLRSLFLIGFIVAMPILALPSVARRLDDYLYGHEKTPLAAETTTRLAAARASDGIAQATFEVPVAEPHPSRTDTNEPMGLDAADTQPPPLAAVPEFEIGTDVRDQATPPPKSNLDLEFSPGNFTSTRKQDDPFTAVSAIPPEVTQVRQRLEDLGADYVLLEEDGFGQYRFHCRMLVTAGSEETQSFEAEGAGAAAVASQVLKTVAEWRASQISAGR